MDEFHDDDVRAFVETELDGGPTGRRPGSFDESVAHPESSKPQIPGVRSALTPMNATPGPSAAPASQQAALPAVPTEEGSSAMAPSVVVDRTSWQQFLADEATEDGPQHARQQEPPSPAPTEERVLASDSPKPTEGGAQAIASAASPAAALEAAGMAVVDAARMAQAQAAPPPRPLTPVPMQQAPLVKMPTPPVQMADKAPESTEAQQDDIQLAGLPQGDVSLSRASSAAPPLKHAMSMGTAVRKHNQDQEQDGGPRAGEWDRASLEVFLEKALVQPPGLILHKFSADGSKKEQRLVRYDPASKALTWDSKRLIKRNTIFTADIVTVRRQDRVVTIDNSTRRSTSFEIKEDRDAVILEAILKLLQEKAREGR